MFEQALKEHGFLLARGDRRGFVAVDYQGEVYSLSRYAGLKVKEMEARLVRRDLLSSVDEVKGRLAEGMTRKLQAFIKDAQRDAKQRYAMLDFRRTEMVTRHRDERERLSKLHEKRWLVETNERAARLPRSFTGLWRRLTGEYARIKKQNELMRLRRDIMSYQLSDGPDRGPEPPDQSQTQTRSRSRRRER